MPLRAATRNESPSSAARLRRSDSLLSVSSDSAHSDESTSQPTEPASAGADAASAPNSKSKTVSFNSNVRVQYPRRTSHSFSRFDSLTSLNGGVGNGRSCSPPAGGPHEIDYSYTNANGSGGARVPYVSSPYHPPPQPQAAADLPTVGSGRAVAGSPARRPLRTGAGAGRKFWPNWVWRSNSSTRRPGSVAPAVADGSHGGADHGGVCGDPNDGVDDDSIDQPSPVIKYKVKRTSPLVSRKLASKKSAGSESPQVRRNHVKKIINLFNRQALVERQRLKEAQETTGPKKGLHDLQQKPQQSKQQQHTAGLQDFQAITVASPTTPATVSSTANVATLTDPAMLSNGDGELAVAGSTHDHRSTSSASHSPALLSSSSVRQPAASSPSTAVDTQALASSVGTAAPAAAALSPTTSVKTHRFLAGPNTTIQRTVTTMSYYPADDDSEPRPRPYDRVAFHNPLLCAPLLTADTTAAPAGYHHHYYDDDDDDDDGSEPRARLSAASRVPPTVAAAAATRATMAANSGANRPTASTGPSYGSGPRPTTAAASGSSPPHTDSSLNNSDRENSSFRSGASSFLNRDSGVSLPSSPIRSTSPGPYISTVTLNHSPTARKGMPHTSSFASKNYRGSREDDFHSLQPFIEKDESSRYLFGSGGGQSSDDSMYSDTGIPPQRPLRTKTPSALNIPPLPLQFQHIPPPMKDAAVQVSTATQVKPGNLTPVEEFPSSRVYAPLYSQVNKALKSGRLGVDTSPSPPPVPPPPPPPSLHPAWDHVLPHHVVDAYHRPLGDPYLSGGDRPRSHSPQYRSPHRRQHSAQRCYSPAHRYEEFSPPLRAASGGGYADDSHEGNARPAAGRLYDFEEHGVGGHRHSHSDLGLSDGDSAPSRSRTPVSHVKTSNRTFGFNIGTKKKVKSKKSKTAQESDSSSTSSNAGGERGHSLLRANSAARNYPTTHSASRAGHRTQRYSSMLDLSPSYGGGSGYPTYEDEYGTPPKPPHTYSWTLSLGRAPKSKRPVDVESNAGVASTPTLYSNQIPVRRAYSDAPSSIDEDQQRYHQRHQHHRQRNLSDSRTTTPRSQRGGLAAAFHHRNARGTLTSEPSFNSGASSCGSVAASEAAGVREPIVLYIPGVQRTRRAPPDAALNRSNSFLQQPTTADRRHASGVRSLSPPGESSPTFFVSQERAASQASGPEHKPRFFAKKEYHHKSSGGSGAGKPDRYKKDPERERERTAAVQRSQSIPRNTRLV